MASIFEKQARDINALKNQNRTMLEHAALQNQQMQNLQNQLAQASAVQEETLRNQLKHAQELFEQKMYKDMLFLISNIVEIIQSINDPILKYYFINTHYGIFKMHSEIAMETLTEIVDKQTAKKTILNLDNEINAISPFKGKYDSSILAKYDSLYEDYDKLISAKSIIIVQQPEKPPVDNINSVQLMAIWGAPLGVALMIVGFFSLISRYEYLGLFLFIIGLIALVVGIINKSKIKQMNQIIEKYNKDLEIFKKNQSEFLAYDKNEKEHPIHAIEKEIKMKHSDFQLFKDRIDGSILKFNEKWKPNKN